MTRDDLGALYVRLLAATGPDRELDAQIGLAVGHIADVTMPHPPGRTAYRDIGPEHLGEYRFPFSPHVRWYWPDRMPTRDMVRPYTALIDAARTAMPAGWHSLIHDRPDYPGVEVFEFPVPCRRIPFLHAATVPLSISAAAIAARIMILDHG